jgi:thymidylate synthase (FAD)
MNDDNNYGQPADKEAWELAAPSNTVEKDEDKPVRLITMTENLERELLYCARVSNPANQNSTNSRLLNYCARNAEWSVFEMGNIVMEINTSRTIARQILRHRSCSFQEFSQRYSDVKALGEDVLLTEARRQDLSNRQSSIDDMSPELKNEFKADQLRLHAMAMALYSDYLDKGVAKECARVFLPEGLSKSRMYMNGTVRSWIHYVQLRCGKETQLEHRIIAEEAKRILLDAVPSLKEVLGNIEAFPKVLGEAEAPPREDMKMNKLCAPSYLIEEE